MYSQQYHRARWVRQRLTCREMLLILYLYHCDMAAEETADFTVVDSGYREIADGIYAIRECNEAGPLEEVSEEMELWFDAGNKMHASQVAYLIKSSEKSLLFDTLSPMGEDFILRHLETLLDEPLDYLAPSHPEANHAGNAAAILRAYPDATLVGSNNGAHHELFGFDTDRDNTMLVDTGDRIDLGDHTVEIVHPVWYDHPITMFMLELKTDVLFTADWFSNVHMEGDCQKFADELTNELHYNQIERQHGNFTPMKFGDPDKIGPAVDHVKDEINPSMIAQAHGNQIRTDVDEYLDLMKQILMDITDSGLDYENRLMRQLGGKGDVMEVAYKDEREAPTND